MVRALSSISLHFTQLLSRRGEHRRFLNIKSNWLFCLGKSGSKFHSKNNFVGNTRFHGDVKQFQLEFGSYTRVVLITSAPSRVDEHYIIRMGIYPNKMKVFIKKDVFPVDNR